MASRTRLEQLTMMINTITATSNSPQSTDTSTIHHTLHLEVSNVNVAEMVDVELTWSVLIRLQFDSASFVLKTTTVGAKEGHDGS